MEQVSGQITINEWLTWKEDIRTKLQETAQNFVYIGYRLKQIRDSKMLDGAADIFEFAQNEYGLSKSSVSRFIAINEKFSEDGNSLELKEEYKRFSSSKLSEMLTLPDSECQLITEKTTIKEIRELKSFDRQEVPQNQSEVVYSPLQKCIIDFFQNKPKCLDQVMKLIKNGDEESLKEAAELINPIEQSSHKKGIIFLFMYSWTNGVKYKDLRVKEPVSITWTDFLLVIFDIFGHIESENVHFEYYGIEEKEEPKIEDKKVEETQQNQGFESCCDVATEEAKTEDFEEEKEENETEIESESCEREEVSGGLQPEHSEIDTTERETEAEPSGYSESCNDDPEPVEQLEEAETVEAEETEEESNEAAVEPAVSPSYAEIANNIKADIIERIEYINTLCHFEDMDIADWRGIRAKINNLGCDIEQLIKYIDLADESEEE